jgi:hypothetical protein
VQLAGQMIKPEIEILSAYKLEFTENQIRRIVRIVSVMRRTNDSRMMLVRNAIAILCRSVRHSCDECRQKV